MKNITQALKVVTLALTLSFGISYVYAWTAPTVTPPGGNVSAPINTSATAQYKDGSLGVGGLLKGYGNIQAVTKVESPQYCIGASCITSWPTGGGVTPPAGSEFLNTSATAQTKAGDLKVSGSIGIGLGASSPAQKLDVAGSAQITGTIFGGGAQTTYGATTVRGDKNGWSGINFASASGVNNGTLMMHPSYSGFFNAADNNWRMYATDAGNVYANDYYSNVSGKWASAAQSRVTGSCAVGQAITAINADGTVTCGAAGGGGLGVDQTWVNVAASRVSGGTYINATGKPISVLFSVAGGSSQGFFVRMNGVYIQYDQSYSSAYISGSFIVPNGSSYGIDVGYTGNYFLSWRELR